MNDFSNEQWILFLESVIAYSRESHEADVTDGECSGCRDMAYALRKLSELNDPTVYSC
jgi:hypothetical protein